MSDSEVWSADLADSEFAQAIHKTRTFNALTRVFLVALVAGAGFIAGALVQRSQEPASTVATSAFAARNAANGGGGTGSAGGAGGGGAGGATVGTITLVDGANLYVTTAEGDVVKVITNGQTAITVSKTGTLSDLDPSKTVVVQGTTNADGTVTASQVTQGGFGGFGGGGRRNGGGQGGNRTSTGGGG